MPRPAPAQQSSTFDLHLNHRYLHFRRTKIVATLGPASNSPQMIRKLLDAGVNVFRINFSHGNPADHVKVMKLVRQVSGKAGQPVAILADLCGPKIRVGMFKGDSIVLKDGTTVTITVDNVMGEPGLIPSQYAGLVRDVKVGETILLDDGNLELKVTRKMARSVQAKVIHGGVLKNKKGMNLPESAMSVAALSPKDRSDVAYCVEGGADYIALSFVRQPSDITDLRRVLTGHKANIPIIAKIEKPEALHNIERIMDLADGIMVARGDLGVELPPKKVPIIQNNLIRIANERSKPVIVATQMLESMIDHARPTRAEVTDVAGACMAGTDAVMLSAETASGKFPLLAVEMMDSILRETEAYQFFARKGWFAKAGEPNTGTLHGALAEATAQLSRDLMVRAVFVLTKSGTTARVVSSDRPAAPILAMTRSEALQRQLCLLWGVYAFVAPRGTLAEGQLAHGEKLLKKLKLAGSGDYVLMISGLTSATTSIGIHRLA